MKDMIAWAATAIQYEVSEEDIHNHLHDEGMTEEEIYLTIKAGEIIAHYRNNGDV
jgi:hypothetical protein